MFLFKNILSVFIAVIFTDISVSDKVITKIYPVPPANENSLFYIQRTKNTNAIVYEVNHYVDGKINQEDPLKIYWIKYSTDSSMEDLSIIQRKYAYGVTSRPYNGQNNSFVIQFNSYKKRNIFLLPVNNGKRYAAFISINGKLAELKRIFVSTSGGSFWFPTIDYVELTGKDPASQQTTVERFIP